ncbi:AsmA family protein [Motiliproteus sp. SC1-56]|uniref:AsmA family protein n=1 Tax=Motiliproteus sp. SC1-56 TaxID=2799565 RepID=UPI001A8D08A4|nr:AsmA family protein [Motiliproteus sp. SC1-56]
MKLFAKLFAGLLILLLLAAGIFLATFDPNDYKPQIERLAQEKAGLALDIQGDIGWSLFPGLALALPALEVADASGQPLAALERAEVGVALLPLLSGELKMSGLVVHGLALDIIRPPGTEKPAASKPDSEPAPEGAVAGAPGLLLDVGRVEILDARIRYQDPQAGQRLLLEDFNFRADNLVSARSFPARMAFTLSLYQAGEAPVLRVESEFDGQLYLDLKQQQYRAEQAALKLTLQGEAFGDQAVPVQFDGALGADLAQETAFVRESRLSLANMSLQASLQVAGLSGTPRLSGEFKAPAFDLKKLLHSLGVTPPQTQDDEALRALAFAAKVDGPAGTLGLNALELDLDDTRFKGELRMDLTSGAQSLRLQGGQLNLDRYLPPAPEGGAGGKTEAAPADGSAEGYSKAPLLPLETLRGLKLDADLGLEALQVAGLHLQELALKMSAHAGRVEVSEVSGRLYQGAFNNSALIDARTEPVTYSIQKNVSDIALGELLQDLTEKAVFSGRFDMQGQYRARGNSVYDIVNSLDGNMNFDLSDGRLEGVNLTDTLCRGILRLQGKTPGSASVADYTEFSNVRGSVTLDKGVASNQDLRASLVGVSLDGAGTVDLPQEALDYGLDLSILQELKGPNCQIDEQLHNLALPLRCKGGFGQPPAELCGPDTARMKEAIAALYGEKAKAKVEEAKEEAKGKLREKLQEKLKEDGKLQDALRGLFN